MTQSNPISSDDVHQALRQWSEPNNDASSLDYLYLYKQTLQQSASNARQATNQVLLNAIQIMEVDYDPQAAELLRRRFLESTPMYLVANQINMAEATAHKKQRQAILQLTEILQSMEEKAQTAFLVGLESRLNLPAATRLIGIETPLGHLLKLINDPASAWLISVEGLGGIGKTALANALLRRIAPTARFHNVAWVSAKQQEFLPTLGIKQSSRPALDVDTLVDTVLGQLDDTPTVGRSPQEKLLTLTKLLKSEPYLVVVDNLETILDYQTLLPALQKLINPSKFLLTSRAMQVETGVSRFTVTELNKADTLAFLKHEAEARQLDSLARASDAQLEHIVEVVGGNPLALKLVVGQLYSLPLSQVLDSLKRAHSQKVDDLYTYIYWQAWQNLDAAGRQLLLAMPVAQNGTVDHIAAISQLETAELHQALEQLLNHSLLEISGDIDERRYRIHRLTETFLLTEVAKW